MKKQSLNGQWQLRIIGENVFAIAEKPIPATVPGSVYGTLLHEGLMPDPHWRDNELKALELMDNDFEYSRDFVLEKEMLSGDALILRFDGIDTLADIYLNETLLGSTANMHRVWEYDISALAVAGENRLRLRLHSPVRYIKEKNAQTFAGGSWDAMLGYPHLRKTHCMFGWDWGPRLPDAGVFRDVTLLSYRTARLESVHVRQEHSENEVVLDVAVTVDRLAADDGCQIELAVTPPDGGSDIRAQIALPLPEGQLPQKDTPVSATLRLAIPVPQLWWPNGYGDQPLYTVRVRLYDGTAAPAPLDSWERRIGLRTMGVNTAPDQWGHRFAHEINGLQIFAMGADYIPEDNIFGRINRERSERLLKDAVAAHYNIIRVWGGGYYPDDFFFDLCDELGLLVWQDFMFACASYELDDDFEANIKAEVRDNIRRIRHHACLAVWCGNNEMEEQMLHQSWRPSNKQKYDYIKMFEYIIPRIVAKEDPATFYWPSSPSSGGNYDDPGSENVGDAHYWGVWHGNEPFTAYRDHYFRYLSEFGFQSFPAYPTIEAFTEPDDRNIFSYVMEMHQRNNAANGKIMNYLAATYRYPTDFCSLIYASQLLQAEAMRYGIEHNRRHRGRCMGTVVWQLNDIWPVASWASIDYFGRWKALHYYEKRAFAPLMISCEEKGEMDQRPHPNAEPAPFEKSARLHVTNETRAAVSGTIRWALKNPDSSVIFLSGQQNVTVAALDGLWLDKIDLAGYDEREAYLAFSFEDSDGRVVSAATCLFTPPKYYHFADPRLTYSVNGNLITVRSAAYAKNVEIAAANGDIWLSDNYFDMEAGEVTVEILRHTTEDGNIPDAFTLRSVYDIR